MKAICRAEYEGLVAKRDAEEKRHEELLEAQKELFAREGRTPEGSAERREAERKLAEARQRTADHVVPKVPFFNTYGLWFYGLLAEKVREIGRKRFRVALENRKHAYVDAQPASLTEGVHEIEVYELPCRLYFWRAQGYLRGLVVLADDAPGNEAATVFLGSRTWSWALGEEDRAKLPPGHGEPI